jgi:hypothetical protein
MADKRHCRRCAENDADLPALSFLDKGAAYIPLDLACAKYLASACTQPHNLTPYCRRLFSKKTKKSGANAVFCTIFSRHSNVKMQKINANFIFRKIPK